MDTTLPSSLPQAIVMDASVAVAISAKESDKEAQAEAALALYTAQGCDFFAPGALVSETLYVLCKKLEKGDLSGTDYAQSVEDFHSLLSFIQSPPQGEISLVLRAEEIRGDYACRRSTDSIYIALAEELTQVRPTVLLTFDEGMVKQAAKNASSVAVQLLTLKMD